jgi:hypothetical protein
MSFLFWYVTPCTLFKFKRRFEKYVATIFRAEEEIQQETSMKKAGFSWCLLQAGFLFALLFNLNDDSGHVLPKRH